MRRRFLGLALVSFLGLIACQAGGDTPVRPSEVPRRKAGLWRQTLVMDGRTATPLRVDYCADAPTEAKLLLGAQIMSNPDCAEPRFRRRGDGTLVFDSACQMRGGGAVSTHGSFRGDFTRVYDAIVETAISGASTGAGDERHRTEVHAIWLGGCRAGEIAGDMTMRNGLRINLLRKAPHAPPP